ncbi:MAG: RraA family protein [Acidobacteriota bacterium]|jgi:regulator of RNase E activity RraA
MTLDALADAFAPLSTAALCDAAVRCGVPARVAPAGIRSIPPGARLAGPVLPARHAGSVDVFLEALEESRPGDVLVIDDGGRTDRACVGDLIVLECRAAGLAGLLVWGAHRDTWDLQAIGLPVFSYGAAPPGPPGAGTRDRMALSSARFGPALVARGEMAFADEDGVLFLGAEAAEEVLPVARKIREAETRQAEALRDGRRLRDQLGLREYLQRRAADPSYTFRDHLRERDAEVES